MMAIDAFSWAASAPPSVAKVNNNNVDRNLNFVVSAGGVTSPVNKGVLITHRPRTPRKPLKRVQVMLCDVV